MVIADEGGLYGSAAGSISSGSSDYERLRKQEDIARIIISVFQIGLGVFAVIQYGRIARYVSCLSGKGMNLKKVFHLFLAILCLRL